MSSFRMGDPHPTYDWYNIGDTVSEEVMWGVLEQEGYFKTGAAFDADGRTYGKFYGEGFDAVNSPHDYQHLGEMYSTALYHLHEPFRDTRGAGARTGASSIPIDHNVVDMFVQHGEQYLGNNIRSEYSKVTKSRKLLDGAVSDMDTALANHDDRGFIQAQKQFSKNLKSYNKLANSHEQHMKTAMRRFFRESYSFVQSTGIAPNDFTLSINDIYSDDFNQGIADSLEYGAISYSTKCPSVLAQCTVQQAGYEDVNIQPSVAEYYEPPVKETPAPSAVARQEEHQAQDPTLPQGRLNVFKFVTLLEQRAKDAKAGLKHADSHRFIERTDEGSHAKNVTQRRSNSHESQRGA